MWFKWLWVQVPSLTPDFVKLPPTAGVFVFSRYLGRRIGAFLRRNVIRIPMRPPGGMNSISGDCLSSIVVTGGVTVGGTVSLELGESGAGDSSSGFCTPNRSKTLTWEVSVSESSSGRAGGTGCGTDATGGGTSTASSGNDSVATGPAAVCCLGWVDGATGGRNCSTAGFSGVATSAGVM